METDVTWRERFKLARPNADAPSIERAIDAVLADPDGDYANEIRRTAERAKPNPMRNYSNLQLRASLANWSDTERAKVTDTRGYGSSDRQTFKYRADLLDAAIARLIELEDRAALDREGEERE